MFINRFMLLLTALLAACNTDKVIWESNINDKVTIREERYSLDSLLFHRNVPVTSGKIVLLGKNNKSNNGHITAFEAATGKIIWKSKKGDNQFKIDHSGIYFRDSGIYRLNLETGNIDWGYPINELGIISKDNPQFVKCDSTVFLSAEHSIVAVDINTGIKRWINTENKYVFPGVCYEKSNLFLVADDKGSVNYLEFKTGKIRKKFITRALSLKTKKYVENVLVENTKTKDFHFSPGNDLLFPTIKNDRLLFVSSSDLLQCLDLSTGKILWKSKIIKTLPWSYPLSIVANQVIVTGEYKLVAYSLNSGSEKWTIQHDQTGAVRFQVLGQELFLRNGEKGIRVYDVNNGVLKKTFNITKAMLANTFFTVEGKTIYYLTRDKLVAERLSQ